MNPTLLNRSIHDTLCITDDIASIASEQNSLPVLADELRHLVLEFPVCFIRHPQTQAFSMHALLGFETRQNVFIENGRWQANYLPLHLARMPFMATQVTDKDGKNTLALSIDLDSPLVGESGKPLYEKDGSPTQLLKQKSQLAFSLVEAIERTQQFTTALEEADLLTAITIKSDLSNGEHKAIEGVYSIDESKLASLSGDTLIEFHKRGYLQACAYLIASLGNIKKMIKRYE